MKTYKRPESILVVIYAKNTGRVLMLQRKDDAAFWQSVSGSLEEGETPYQAAGREVKEETGIDIEGENLTLIDCQHSVFFDIFPQFQQRYAPNVTQCKEHWFLLALPAECDVVLTEHLSFAWHNAMQAAAMTKSWNNRQAIENYLINLN